LLKPGLEARHSLRQPPRTRCGSLKPPKDLPWPQQASLVICGPPRPLAAQLGDKGGTCRQTDERGNGRTDRQSGRWTDRQTDVQTDKQMIRWTDKQKTDTQTGR
jgi:hypothetical protein